MDAIVLAGGYATRLWPITVGRPKMFLPLGETTILDRILSQLHSDDRIDDVYVSTNARYANDFRDHFATQNLDTPTLSIEGTTTENEKLGVVGALAELVDRENLTDDTIVVAGDNLIGFNIAEFLDHFLEHESPTLAAYDVGSRERAKSYGLVELEDGRIVDFQEKPDSPKSTLVSIACYGFTADTLDLLEKYLTNGNNPDEPGWFLQWLHRQKPVHAFTFDDAWFDVGTAESYLDAVAWHLDGDQYVHDSATLEHVNLGPNVHLMKDVELRDVSISNAVVFPETTLENTEIERAVIDRNSRIDSVPVNEALIGEQTVLTANSIESD